MAFVLQGLDRTFDHGDAAVLPYSTIAGLNPCAPTEILEPLAPEDFILVADKIVRRRVDASQEPVDTE